MTRTPEMRTISGIRVDLLNPTEDMVDWMDVAHHLSVASRYAGGVPAPYAISQHCVLVHEILREQGHNDKTCLLGLLHDAEETYVGDVITPTSWAINEMCPGAKEAFDNIKDQIRRTVCRKAGITDAQYDAAMPFVHVADMMAYEIELRDILRQSYRSEIITVKVKVKEIMGWEDAKDLFLSALNMYSVLPTSIAKVA